MLRKKLREDGVFSIDSLNNAFGILKGKYYILWEMQQGNFNIKDEEENGFKEKMKEEKEIEEDDEDTIVYT